MRVEPPAVHPATPHGDPRPAPRTTPRRTGRVPGRSAGLASVLPAAVFVALLAPLVPPLAPPPERPTTERPPAEQPPAGRPATDRLVAAQTEGDSDGGIDDGTGGGTDSTDASYGHDRLGVRRADRSYLRPDLAGGPAVVRAEGPTGWTTLAGRSQRGGADSLWWFRDGVWVVRDTPGGALRSFRFGLRGDRPVVGDWDGDGADGIGVLRGGRWYVRDAVSGGPNRSFGFGLPGDLPVAGDWDGDGRAGVGVVRGATWYLRPLAAAGPASETFSFGRAGDVPVVGDWDHDRRDTAGTFRDGAWTMRVSATRQATARFGLRGDLPVVRREPGLAPGVAHRVVRDPRGFVAHVVSVDLGGSARPDVVLSGGTVDGTETTSSMARRSGAVAAVNGDFATRAGRPVHLIGGDGRLWQSPLTAGKALGLGLPGSAPQLGTPALEVTTDLGGTTVPVSPVNVGAAGPAEVAAHTAVGGSAGAPPDGHCYAGLSDAVPVLRDGVLHTEPTVTGRRCGGEAPRVPARGTILSAPSDGAHAPALAGAVPGEAASLRTRLGFAGAVDVLGGNPLVLTGGEPTVDVDGSGSFFARNPRTAVGTTPDGRLLLVVVDGRQSGYSTGATLRELAETLQSLGATTALNLDGGGSTTLWLNGVVANRPSDGPERGVSSALVVLPGADPGEAGIVEVLGSGRHSRRPTPAADPWPGRRVGPARPLDGPPGSAARAASDPAGSAGLPALRQAQRARAAQG